MKLVMKEFLIQHTHLYFMPFSDIRVYLVDHQTVNSGVTTKLWPDFKGEKPLQILRFPAGWGRYVRVHVE